MRKTILLSILILLGCSGKDQESRQIFELGEKAYNEGRYADALSLFTRVDSTSGVGLKAKAYLLKIDSLIAPPWLPNLENGTTQEESTDQSEQYDQIKSSTTEWLNELGKSNFAWSDDLHAAFFSTGRDTILLSRDYEFGTDESITIRMGAEYKTLADSAYWSQKALMLAKEVNWEEIVSQLIENPESKTKKEKYLSQQFNGPDNNEWVTETYTLEIDLNEDIKVMKISHGRYVNEHYIMESAGDSEGD